MVVAGRRWVTLRMLGALKGLSRGPLPRAAHASMIFLAWLVPVACLYPSALRGLVLVSATAR